MALLQEFIFRGFPYRAEKMNGALGVIKSRQSFSEEIYASLDKRRNRQAQKKLRQRYKELGRAALN